MHASMLQLASFGDAIHSPHAAPAASLTSVHACFYRVIMFYGSRTSLLKNMSVGCWSMEPGVIRLVTAAIEAILRVLAISIYGFPNIHINPLIGHTFESPTVQRSIAPMLFWCSDALMALML
jgi:hypothetical protein